MHKLRSPYVENSELLIVLPSKRGVGQNIAVYASPTAGNFSLPKIYLPGTFSFIRFSVCLYFFFPPEVTDLGVAKHRFLCRPAE